MRIAIFTETFLPKIDGIVTRLTQTIRCLGEAGDDVLVFAPGRPPETFAGAEVHAVGGVPLPLYPELKLAPPGPRVASALRRFKPDLVHVVNPAVLGAGGIFLAKRLGLPLIASYHTHLPRYLAHYRLGRLEPLMWLILRLMHNRAGLNLCTSSSMVRELTDHGIRRCALWQRGVDTETFNPGTRCEATRRELTQGRPDDPLIVFVGRLAAEKEIERIAPVLEALPQLRLALVGDGPNRARLERLFPSERVYFAGYRKGRDLSSAFASADALVFPSRTETLGLVLLEAMAAGCPVLAADAPGVTDIVRDGENGALFNPASDDDIVRATAALLQDEAAGRRFREAARAEAMRWSWENATAQLRDYYGQVLEDAASPAASRAASALAPSQAASHPTDADRRSRSPRPGARALTDLGRR